MLFRGLKISINVDWCIIAILSWIRLLLQCNFKLTKIKSLSYYYSFPIELFKTVKITDTWWRT